MSKNDLVLYHIGFSRSTTTLWLLEELGEPYKVCPVSKDRETRDPSFQTINPLNKVPVLNHSGKIITEAAAICLYLAEVFPKAGLGVEVGSKKRADYLKWSIFVPSCLEPAILDQMYGRKEIPIGSSGWGDFNQLINYVSSELSKYEFILGDRFTSADVVLASQLGWGLMIGKVPRTPDIVSYMERMDQRPARKRVLTMEENRTWPV